jgi:hypothetical protein
MNFMTEAYITGVGAYLPGDQVGNEELAARFGDGSPRGAARRAGAVVVEPEPRPDGPSQRRGN